MARALLEAKDQTRTRLLSGSAQESRTPSRYDSDSAWSTDREHSGEPVRFGRRVGVNEKADEHFGEKAEELADRYAKGDEKADEELYRRYDARQEIERKLKGWGLNANEADVEDIESSAWTITLRAIRNRKKTQKFAFSTIFFKAINFASLNWWRENKRNLRRTESLDHTIDASDDSTRTRLDTIAAGRSFENDVMEVFGSLPKSIREVVELAAGGKTKGEIAEAIGMTEGTVEQVLENVKAYLKKGTSASGAGAETQLFAQRATYAKDDASAFNRPGFAQGTSAREYNTKSDEKYKNEIKLEGRQKEYRGSDPIEYVVSNMSFCSPKRICLI